MPIVIENISTTMNLQDEDKIRELVREEVRHLLMARMQSGGASEGGVDPTDPAAASKPLE